MVFYYRERLDPTRLEQALALVLGDFPTFAGSLVSKDGQLRMDHSAGGVQFEVVESEASLDELEAAGKESRTTLIGPRISSASIVRGKASMLAVRLTLVQRGSALCIVWNHAVGDMQTMMLLMRAWARAYQDLPYEKPNLIEDLDEYLKHKLPDPRGAKASVRLASWGEIVRYVYRLTRPCSRFTVEFSWAEIQAIHAAHSDSRRVTANDALCAHVYTVLRELAGISDPGNLCLTLNYRKRVGIPENVLGNLITIVAQPVAESDQPADVAAGLRSRLEQFGTKYIDYHANMRVIEAHAKSSERMRVTFGLFVPGRCDYLVINWTNFGAYDLTFGGSSPSLFCCLTESPAWSMVVLELPRGEGLGIRLALPPALAALVQSEHGGARLRHEASLPTMQVPWPSAAGV